MACTPAVGETSSEVDVSECGVSRSERDGAYKFFFVLGRNGCCGLQ